MKMDASIVHRDRLAGLLIPMIAMLCALALLLGLGTWQWNRKAWKEDLVATIAARSAATPIDAAAFAALQCAPVEVVGLARACDYTAVRLTGTFDVALERHIYTGIDKPAGGGVSGQGFWIMTPFQIAGGGPVIAVNRGFVPETRKEVSSRADGQLSGEVSMTGLIRSAELRATFTGANDPAKNMWYARDPAEVFPAIGPVKINRPQIYLDLQMPVPPGGLPQPTAGRINIPNRHLEYALTWWALAATLLGVFGAFAIGRLKASKVSDS